MKNKLKLNLLSSILCCMACLFVCNKVNAQSCPYANADTDSTLLDTPILLQIGLNDSVGPNIPTITITANPSNGTLFIINGDSVVYTPNVGFLGIDVFSYTVCDTPMGCGCASADVLILVKPIPCTLPNAIDDIGATGYSRDCGQYFNVSSNDFGIRPLTVAIISGPLHGTAGVGTNRILYSSDSTLFGAFDTITYSLTNACGADTAQLFIFVNSTYACNGIHPEILHDTIRICRNDDSVVINAGANDFDPDGDYVSIRNLTASPLLGTAYVLSDSQIVYFPPANYSGTDVFYYQGCDDGIPNLCNIGRVFIFIDSCYNAPHITDPTGNDIDTILVNVNEDQDSILCLYVYDLDGDNVSITHINGIEVILDTVYSASDSCLYIHPLPNMYGSDTIMVVLCDDRDTLCDTVYVIINVFPINDPPVGVADIVVYTGGGSILLSPLLNDSDPDAGDTIRVGIIVNLNPNAGSATLNPEGTVTFIPDSNFAGIDTIAYILCDQYGLCDTTAILVIIPVNARDDYKSSDLDQAISILLTSNDAVAANSVINICGNPTHGTIVLEGFNVTYTPAKGYAGEDVFCYVLCDTLTGFCDTAYVFINVTNIVFFIPQGFSPNGDGLNDYFNITGIEKYPNSELTIFNRWGDEVWISNEGGYQNSIAEGFSGLNKKNNPLPDATYFYVLKFNVEGMKNQSGFIQINR